MIRVPFPVSDALNAEELEIEASWKIDDESSEPDDQKGTK
jgi:hypothetical protein